jgi:hypothetical protein
MRTLHYTVRAVRVSDEVWQSLKELRRKGREDGEMSWNTLFKLLIEAYGNETLRRVPRE